jgi:hypothetical protein
MPPNEARCLSPETPAWGEVPRSPRGGASGDRSHRPGVRPHCHEKRHCLGLLRRCRRSSSHERQGRSSEREKRRASRGRAIGERLGLSRNPGGAPRGRDAIPSGRCRTLPRPVPSREQGESRMWRSANGSCHAESMGRRNQRKSSAIQYRSWPTESSAGSERTIRKNEHGGPSHRGNGASTTVAQWERSHGASASSAPEMPGHQSPRDLPPPRGAHCRRAVTRARIVSSLVRSENGQMTRQSAPMTCSQ